MDHGLPFGFFGEDPEDDPDYDGEEADDHESSEEEQPEGPDFNEDSEDGEVDVEGGEDYLGDGQPLMLDRVSFHVPAGTGAGQHIFRFLTDLCAFPHLVLRSAHGVPSRAVWRSAR